MHLTRHLNIDAWTFQSKKRLKSEYFKIYKTQRNTTKLKQTQQNSNSILENSNKIKENSNNKSTKFE